jgi:hypothetical protein
MTTAAKFGAGSRIYALASVDARFRRWRRSSPPHISGCQRHRLGRPETRHPLNRRVKPGNQLRGDWPGPCRNGDNMAGVFENALLRRFRATVTDNVK